MTWQCAECGRIEGEEKKVLIKRLPRNLSRILHLIRLHPNNLDDEHPLLNVINIFMTSEERQEPIRIKVRCHHCGKPLCQQHRILIRDNAFSINEEKLLENLPSWWNNTLVLKANPQFKPFEKRILSFFQNK